MAEVQREPRPAPLLAAAVLVGLQGLVSVGFGLLELASLDPDRPALALTTSVFFLALGAGLVACARGLAVVHSWARGPVVAVELIVLLTAFSFWGGGTTPVAVVLAVVTLAVLAGVLHPASTRALADDPT